MDTRKNHNILVKQLNFMQSLFPFAVQMNYKRTGSFILKASFMTSYLNVSAPVTYEFTYSSTQGKVEIVIASELKSMYRGVAHSFEELEEDIRKIIKPRSNMNAHISKMSYEARLLIWSYVKNRPAIGFVYQSRFDSHVHQFVDKHSNGDVDSYYFHQHSFPLLLDTWDGRKCFGSEQALTSHLLRKF